ncbi:hypothetical protein Efla_003389 [Eimeria flavescens]
MADRVKIHRLEQELNEAKSVIKELTGEQKLREGEQIRSSDPSAKNSAPARGRCSRMHQRSNRFQACSSP